MTIKIEKTEHSDIDLTSASAPSSGASLRATHDSKLSSGGETVGQDVSDTIVDLLTYATMPTISGGFYLWDTIFNGGACLSNLGTRFFVDF